MLFKNGADYDQRLPPWNKGVGYWTDEMRARHSEHNRLYWANPENRYNAGLTTRKPVMTPYGEFPSALQAAKEIAPQLGLKPSTIQSYFIRDKYADWYYVEETA